MSVAAVNWAEKQSVDNPLAKLLLLILAKCANKAEALAWPSVGRLAKSSGVDERSVRRGLAHLRAMSLIEDSGQRRGKTNGIRVWRLRLAEDVLPLVRPKRKRAELNGQATLFADLPAKADSGVRVPGHERRTQPPLNPDKRVRQKDKGKTSKEAAEPREKNGFDPIKEVFDLGVSVLTSTGVAEAQARSLIGRWRKDHSDGEVLTALVACRAQAVSSPVEWLQKRLNGARYVSASGHQYRGSLQAIRREAEKRADWSTYWAVERDLKTEARG